MLLTLTFLLASASPVAAEEDPQRADGDIVVTGRHDEASEGTGDYATRVSRTATRLALSQRDTPQSISVVTRAQIEDFNLTDINALLNTTTGVNVQQTETDRVYYSARGFDITNFQIDGVGLPFAYGLQNGALDTATYDRVEVLRGANGLLSATGNPSATINFVRKRPGKAFAASASAQYGSFDSKRVDADVTVPLTANGSIRARAVGAYLDTDSYLDRYNGTRSIAYGVVEADLGPNTTVSAGYQRQDSRTRAGLWGALPLYYSDGTPTDYPRSTNIGTDWTKWNIRDQQIFGDITHDLGGGWTARVSALRRAIDEDERLLYVYGAPDRTTGDGLFSYPGAFRGPTRNLTLDAYLAGPVTLFGRAHDLVIGVNRGAETLRQYSSYPAGIGTPLPGNSAFDGSYPFPDFPDFTLSADFHTVRESAYGLVRLNPTDRLKLMAGLNLTHARRDGYTYGVASVFDETRALPFFGATFELTPSISAYASYATIFNPQIEIDATYATLPPVTGTNLEAGLKGEWFDGKLNASVSIFRARQNDLAESVGFDTTIGQTVYTTIDAESQGIEFDAGGQVAPGLQLTAGYTLLRIRNPQGDPVRTYVPRSTARLNAVYSPPALPGLKVGAALQYQSRIYREQGTVAATAATIVSEQKGYALVDLMARYDLDEHWSLTGNLRNLTNHKYITSLMWAQGYYGAPRSVTATIAWRF